MRVIDNSKIAIQNRFTYWYFWTNQEVYKIIQKRHQIIDFVLDIALLK